MALNFVLTLALAANLGDAIVPPLSLVATDGKPRDLKAEVAKAPLTVFTFFSRKCPCVRAHDPVMVKLRHEFAQKGVQFFIVDSEVGSSIEGDAVEAQRRGYLMPMLLDTDAKLSRAFGANIASTSVIVDSEGKLLYRGAIDSSRKEPTPDATPYLRDAIVALLDGKTPPATEPKSLGCYLKRK